MNNNFSFNYNKNLDEKKVDVERIEEDSNKYNYNYSDNYNNNNNSSKKYKIIGILLGGFLSFLVLFIILGLTIRNNLDNINFENNSNQSNKDNTSLENEKINNVEYNYDINYKINNITYFYKYKITTNDKYTYITKTYDDYINNYVYYEDYYYLIYDHDYKLVFEDVIFDIIPYKFLDVETINDYIKLGTLTDNNIIKRYNVKLEDITLMDSSDVITISLIGNDYEIDYTNLLKLYDDYEYFKVIISTK